MPCRRIVFGLALAVAAATARPAPAWNDTGHKVVALIAYQALDDATKAKVLTILKSHPHYEEYLAKDVPDGVETGEWVAMKAATWSDWVRSGPRERRKFHRGTHHYVNKPYIVVDPDDQETRDEIESRFSDPEQNHGDILKAIPNALKIVKAKAETTKEKENRAVHLCWMFHLIGDLHQPLHAVALCNKQMPGGDKGGNSVYVLRHGDSGPRKLHQVWDSALGNFSARDALVGVAKSALLGAALTDEEKGVTDPDKWADESVAAAKASVYSFNGEMIKFVIDTDSHGPSTAPELPEGYEKNAVAVAKRRAALAGHRLANAIKAALAD